MQVLLSSESRWVQPRAARLCCQPHTCVRFLDGTPVFAPHGYSWWSLKSEACVVKKTPRIHPLPSSRTKRGEASVTLTPLLRFQRKILINAVPRQIKSSFVLTQFSTLRDKVKIISQIIKHSSEKAILSNLLRHFKHYLRKLNNDSHL